MKKNLLKNNGVQSLLASLACVVLGLLIGYIVLLFINPNGAGEAIAAVMKNFLNYSKSATQAKYLGNTLVKTAPLLLCALSILFSYKVGLFNIGAAGQYCAGVALSLYAALAWGWGWLPCMLLAMLGGMALGAISGLLKSYCNVNEVISGIMLNWIVLYLTNMLLTNVKEETSPYTFVLAHRIPRRSCPPWAWAACLTTTSMWAWPCRCPSWRRCLCGSCWKRPVSVMSCGPQATIRMPPSTAVWRKNAISS